MFKHYEILNVFYFIQFPNLTFVGFSTLKIIANEELCTVAPITVFICFIHSYTVTGIKITHFSDWSKEIFHLSL